MSYQVFARKYRPKTFDDVLGQEHVVRTLKNAIAQNRLAHAYLFVGPRGTGKTSTARILAKALNCTGGPRMDFDPEEDICRAIAEGRSLDVLEIDGASNNGVEQVRELRETVAYAPAQGKFRIYYIDEVHMLTTNAFNALLKTLEEPPAHVKFIFATTEANKILPTILSRCQRFDLRRIPDSIIADHLLHIASLEGLNLEVTAAHTIARGAEGGMRDAQSMLDQLVAFCGSHVRQQDVLDIFGFTSYETIAEVAGAILARNNVEALSLLHKFADAGKDLTRLLADLLGHFRNLLVLKADPDFAKEASPDVLNSLKAQAGHVTTDKLLSLIDQFAEVDGRMKWATNKKLYLEIGFIKAIRSLAESNLSDVITALQSAVTGGPAQRTEAAPARVSAPASAAPAPAPAQPAAPVKAGAEPAPEPVRESTGDLWTDFQREVEVKKPLLGGWVKEGHFLGVNGNDFVLGFSTGSAMARESLGRPNTKAALEDLLARLNGSPLTLKLEVRADLAAPPPIDLKVAAPSGDEPPPFDPDPQAASPAKAAGKPAPAADSGGQDKAAEEAFYSDPLIKDALRIFEAKLSSVTPEKK